MVAVLKELQQLAINSAYTIALNDSKSLSPITTNTKTIKKEEILRVMQMLH